MIKKLIDKLLGKSGSGPARKASPFGQRQDVPASVQAARTFRDELNAALA